MADQVDLEMIRADTVPIDVTLRDGNDALINDAGATYTLTVRTGWAAAAAFTKNANQTSAGTARLTILPADTVGYTHLRVLVYDVQVAETDGRVTTLQYGKLTVKPDVSHA